MVQIALDRGRQMRRLGAGLAALQGAAVAAGGATGVAPPLQALMHQRVFDLQVALERMANVKEYRTPMVGGCSWWGKGGREGWREGGRSGSLE